MQKDVVVIVVVIGAVVDDDVVATHPHREHNQMKYNRWKNGEQEEKNISEAKWFVTIILKTMQTYFCIGVSHRMRETI